jgi:hypothetical protein
LTAGANNLWVFSIQLPENERLEFLLQSKYRPEIEQIVKHFHNLTGKPVAV